MASQLELFLPANYTHPFAVKCTCYQREHHGFEGVVNFPFAIERILGIKHIFTCSFENKHMHLLTHVYGMCTPELVQVVNGPRNKTISM